MGEKRQCVLITGAGGYLATELTKQLSAANYQIFGLTSDKEKFTRRFSQIDGITCFGNEDIESGEMSWDKVDSLIHCAFARGYRSNQEIAESLCFTNKIFTQAAENSVKSIINISSQGVYSQAYKPLWNENTPVAPDSIYGLAKYSSELLSYNAREISRSNTYITNLRLASLTGGRKGLIPEVISKFVNHAIKGQPIKVIGGKQILSYMDVRDSAAGIIALLSTDPEKRKQVYNLGPAERCNINQIAELTAETAKKYVKTPVKIELEESKISLDVGMDSSLFYSDAGWRPQYDMKATIESLFEYFNEQTHINYEA